MADTERAPKPAASIIVVRDAAPGIEVLLVRRHAQSGFMAGFYVFPGGRIEPGEEPRRAAVRELFEEAGILLAPERLDGDAAALRAQLHRGEIGFDAIERASGGPMGADALPLWGRWITPDGQPARFDTWFYVARLPADQSPSFDARETVDTLWRRPDPAPGGDGDPDVPLPPPQLQTMAWLGRAQYTDVDALFVALTHGADRECAILPRAARGVTPRLLLFPWDRDYLTSGTGDALAISADHVLATGPSRVQLDGAVWRFRS